MSKPFVPSWCGSADHQWRPNRRDFLFTGVIGTLGLTMGNLFKLQAAAATSGQPAKAAAQSVIQIYLPGGMAAQETFDPKLLAPIEFRGPYHLRRSNTREPISSVTTKSALWWIEP